MRAQAWPPIRRENFDRFYTDRSDQPLENSLIRRRFGHSGLGLSISRQIARAHGGDLIAENRPDGTGAYFTLSLPSSRDTVQAETR